ncbi:MAG: RHS repeat domain-containing protein [Bacteroidota bacterium]
MGCLKLTYQSEKNPSNLHVMYRKGSSSRGYPEMKTSENPGVGYYPFGMLQPKRNFNASDYRFGMNGMESDPEITGNWGSHYTAEYWMYDARIGRRWETDPITYPWQSPYATFNNNPVYFIDPLGLEGEEPKGSENNPMEVPGGPIIIKPEGKENSPGINNSINNALSNDLQRIGLNLLEKTSPIISYGLKITQALNDKFQPGDYVDKQPVGIPFKAEGGGGFNMTIATEETEEKENITEMLYFKPKVGGSIPTGTDAIPYLFDAGKNLIQSVTDVDVENKILEVHTYINDTEDTISFAGGKHNGEFYYPEDTIDQKTITRNKRGKIIDKNWKIWPSR